jgi:transcriptional regulator with XRE-family HTH domain
MNKRQTDQWRSEIEQRRNRRRLYDLTLLTVAQRVGVSETTVWRWERGGKKPTQELIRKWDNALFKEAK